MNFIYITALLVLLFVITYNPSQPATETYKKSTSGGCCANTIYRARDPTQCENAYYQGLQFGYTDYGCPPRVPKVCMGAIIGK